MNCTTTCNNCNKCDDKCPYCGYKGKEVKLETVAELTKNKCVFFENGEKIYICTNKKCDLVYFQVGNPKVYLKEEIKVPVWFKEKYKNYIVCYCHNIYLDDIVKIVKNTNESNLTKKDILNLLNTNHLEDCKHLNPTGENCDILFKNAIQFAYNQKEKGEKQ